MIDFVFLHIALVDILGGHAECLGEGDEEVEEVDDFNAGVLLVEFLVFGPPFPGEAIDELGEFLGHGAGVVEGPLGFVLGGEVGEIDPNLFIEEVLHAEDFVEFIGGSHRELVAGGG